MQQLGWDPYANDHEDANCQFEINWTYSDALTTADRHTFFKWMARTVAEQHDLLATFMPKPFGNLTGNGAHVHLSLADEKGKNVFFDSSADLGLSQLGRWFMGGVLRHARGLSASLLLSTATNAWCEARPARERRGPRLCYLWIFEPYANDSDSISWSV
jgi:glutamine synthetase